MKCNYELFIDTTGNFCYLGLYSNNTKIDFIKLEVNKNVTDLVVPAIDDILNKHKAKHTNISKLYLNIGPGSFTGTKVGVIIAKAWNSIKTIKAYTIDSLRLQLGDRDGISIIDAKSNKLYLSVYQKGKCVVKPTIINKSELNKVAKKFKNLILVEDKNDESYDNLVMCKKYFKLQNITELEPLYIKHPIQ